MAESQSRTDFASTLQHWPKHLFLLAYRYSLCFVSFFYCLCYFCLSPILLFLFIANCLLCLCNRQAKACY